MLYIIFADSDEEAAKLGGKPCLEFPDIIFMRKTVNHDFWNDELFQSLLLKKALLLHTLKMNCC